MTLKVETDTRSKLLQEWEELRATCKPTSTPKQSRPHGDANSWILELNNSMTRAQAMQNLCAHHRHLPDLGILLWHSFGAVSSLLQEVMNVYLHWKVDRADASRVNNALSLLESIARHPNSKAPFVCSKLHEIISPLALQGPATPQLEEFRFGALRVFHALLNTENSDRSYIAEKEYGCIATLLLVDDSLNNMILTSAKYGDAPSKLLAIKILAEVLKHDDTFVVFGRHPRTRRNMCLTLEYVQSVFLVEMPEKIPVVKKLYRMVRNMERLDSNWWVWISGRLVAVYDAANSSHWH